jgi:serine/threonine protein kinase
VKDLSLYQQVIEEASILANLHHPNIVQYLGLTKINNELWMVLEYVSGGSLLDLLHSHEYFFDEKNSCKMYVIIRHQ